MSKKILLPYDFTSYNQKALDFVIQTFGKQPEIRVTLFHAYAQLLEIDLTANPEMAKLRSPMISLNQELKEKEAELHAVMGHFVKNGFHGEQLDCRFIKRQKGVSDTIIRMVKKEGYQIVVLSRTPGKIFRLLDRSVSGRVVASLKEVTVCIAL